MSHVTKPNADKTPEGRIEGVDKDDPQVDLEEGSIPGKNTAERVAAYVASKEKK